MSFMVLVSFLITKLLDLDLEKMARTNGIISFFCYVSNSC